jgi:hypothetical protein
MKCKIYALLFFTLTLNTWLNAAVIESNGTGSSPAGMVGGDWTDPITWAGGMIPGPTDDVIIKAGDQVNAINFAPLATQQIHEGNLTIETGAELLLFLDGMTFKGATLKNDGCINITGGALWFQALAAPLLPPSQIFDGVGVVKGNISITNDIILPNNASQLCNEFRFINGKVYLKGNANFKIEIDVFLENADRYFVMETGNSYLSIVINNNDRVFPIGTPTGYSPAQISSAGLNTYQIGVTDAITHSTFTNETVKREWEVVRADGAANPYNLTLYWVPSYENVPFNNGSCAVSHWNGTVFTATQMNAGSSAVGFGQRKRTLTATTETGFFAVVSGQALPLDLLSFKGVEKGLSNVFRWVTANEENSARQVLERWNPLNDTWTTVADVKGSGNSTEPRSYSLEDRNPIEEGYYRLKFIDFDGAHQFSKAIFIKRKADITGMISVYPNPMSDEVSVNYKAPKLADNVEFQLLDQFGKMVQKQALDINSERVDLNLGALPQGQYYFRMVSDNGVEVTQKVIKQ